MKTESYADCLDYERSEKMDNKIYLNEESEEFQVLKNGTRRQKVLRLSMNLASSVIILWRTIITIMELVFTQ